MKTRSRLISAIGVPGLEAHVAQRALGRLAVAGAVEVVGRGHAVGDADDHAGVGAPGDLRRDRRDVDDDLAVEARAVVAAQVAPALDRPLELRARRRARALVRSNQSKVTSSGATMPARPPPSIVMLQTVMRPSIESASIAGPAYSTTWPTAPATPIWPIVARIRSLAVTPKPGSPS